MSDPARVLVRLPNWLGDVLLARPLLHGLHATLPHAEIVTVAPAPLLDLLGAEAVTGRTEPWPTDAVGRNRLARQLAAWRAAVALVLPPSFSSAYFAWRARARVRIGYRHEWRGTLLTHALRRPARGEMHLSTEYLALGQPLGVHAVPLPPLALPDHTIGRADVLFAERGIDASHLAVLGPGALFGPAKRWSATRFGVVGRALAERGMGVLVCGTPAESEICGRVAAEVGGEACSLAGTTDLATQAAVTARATLAVCNDSGLAHLAAALGTPTVVVFGSTSSAWTAPLGPRVRVVQHAPVCSPCFQRTCRIGYRCLEAVAAEEVLSACREVAA